MDDIKQEISKVLEYLEYTEKQKLENIEHVVRDMDAKLDRIESEISRLSSK